jgi:hypothetical protein
MDGKLFWRGATIDDIAPCVIDHCGLENVTKFLNMTRGPNVTDGDQPDGFAARNPEDIEEMRKVRDMSEAKKLHGARPLFECMAAIENDTECQEEVWDRQCEMALTVMNDKYGCDLFDEKNTESSVTECPANCTPRALRMLKPCASAAFRWNESKAMFDPRDKRKMMNATDLPNVTNMSRRNPGNLTNLSRVSKAFYMMKVGQKKRDQGKCDCGKPEDMMDMDMRRKRMMMMKDPSALAADLGLTFPACETEMEEAFEDPVTNVPDLMSCLNMTCVEEYKEAMNFSNMTNMTDEMGFAKDDIDDLISKLDNLTNGSTDAVMEMRKHHKMGPLLQCLEKSPECKYAARDLKCGMAINQGRKMKRGDSMKEVRLAKEMSACASGKLSHKGQRGIVGGRKVPKMFEEDLPGVAFDSLNSTCPMLPRDVLHLKHCFGADIMGKKSRMNPGMPKGGAMAELQDFANEDGRVDKDVMAEKLPMCAGVFDDTFGFSDDADMKACMDMNCARTRGPKEHNDTWGEGHEDVEDALDFIPEMVGNLSLVSTDRVMVESKVLKGLNMCLDNTTDPEFKERCRVAKRGMRCQVGQRISRAKGCDFDRAYERLDRDELRSGEMKTDRPTMEMKPDEATRPVGAGRSGFGVKDQCPKGCSERSMKHLKSCNDVPRKALMGRGGMRKAGDISGKIGAECQEMEQEADTRKDVDKRARPDPKGQLRDPETGRLTRGEASDETRAPLEEGETRMPGRPIKDLIKEGKEDREKPEMEFMETRGGKDKQKGKDENRGDFETRMKGMKDEGRYNGQGTCDKTMFNDYKDATEKRLRQFGSNRTKLEGSMRGRATCNATSMGNAQDVLSITGSCAGSAMDGLRSRGFEKERSSLEMGIRDGVKECEPLTDTARRLSDDMLDGTDSLFMKLDDALTLSDDMLTSDESFVPTLDVIPRASTSGGVPTVAAGLLKNESSMAGVPGNKEMFNCLKKVAPERVHAVKCDFAMLTMKIKHSCDLRGKAGMKAAFAGDKADDLGNRTRHEKKAFGQTRKFEAACDRADRVKETLKEEQSTCPCNAEAFKELAECAMTDAKDIFEGACDSTDKMDMESLKKQFPNCAAELEVALKRTKRVKQVRSSLTMQVSNIADASTQEALNSEETKIAVGRALAKNIGVSEELVEVLTISQASSRRLGAQSRKLAAGDAVIDYLVHVEEGSNQTAEQIQSNVESLTNKTANLTSDITANLQEEGVTAVSVTAVTAAAEAALEDSPTPAPTPGPSPTPLPANGTTDAPAETSAAWSSRLASGVLCSSLIFVAYQ